MEKRGNTPSSSQQQSPSIHDQVIESVVGHLQQQGFSAVKANCDGFSKPGRVRWDEDDDGIVPDITGEHTGATYVFDIEMRKNIEPDAVADRWRLLSVFARRHHGKFYLVVPESKAEYIRRLTRDVNVKPEFLKLSGLD